MKKILFVCFVVCFLFPAANITFAQSDDDIFMLEEITVTAQKREENLQDVATTIDAVTGTELTKWGDTDLSSALNGVSTAMVQSTGSGLNVSIRGMDNDGQPGTSSSMVAVTVDGAYSQAGTVGTSGLYDMDRIEVLAGPQGTLYSRNSSGGVVNMVSKNPTDEYEGSGSIEVGNYSLLNTQGVVNAPLNDKLAVRAAFNVTSHDGYVSNGTEDDDTKGGRVKVKYDPTDDVSIILGTELTYQGGVGSGSGVEVFEDATSDSWTSSDPGYFFRKTADSNRYFMNLTWDLGEIGTLTLLPVYNKVDEYSESAQENRDDGSYAQKLNSSSTEEISTEMRLSSSEDSFIEWMGGLYYYTRDYTSYGSDVDKTSIQDQYADDKSMAAFANATYPVADTLRVNLGGRYTKDDNYTWAHNYHNSAWDPEEVDDLDSDHFDYKLGMEYDLADSILLWGDFSTGYRQAQKNSQENEYLDSYQLGVKSRLLNQRLQLNATAFYYDYTNYQVQIVRTYYNIDGTEEVDHGSGSGAAELYGLDLSTNLVLTDKDRVNFSASYLHTEISDLMVDFTYYDTANYEGGKLNNSPEWTLVGSYEHEFILPNGGSLTAQGNIRFQSEYDVAFFVEESNIPDGMTLEGVNIQEAFTTTDLSLNYAAPGEKLSLNLYVKNLENYAAKVGLQTGSMRISNPRTYGAVLSIRF